MAKTRMDVDLPETIPPLLLDQHIDYLANYNQNKYEYTMTEHLRISGIYWGLTAVALCRSLDRMDRDSIVTLVKSCQRPNGGFSASTGHDAHMLYTLSAVQVCLLLDCLDEIDVDGVVSFVAAQQKEDGSFTGDEWGEVDSRFSFCALACLSLLHRLNAVNVDKAVEFVVSCGNFDGGFGCVPGSESHAGQVFCCVGALAIGGGLHHVDADQLGWWLCERQLPSGGLNGRPEKLPDVCYSWWVLSSLAVIKRLHWINGPALRKFILAAQDDESGGIADRPGDMSDPYHTLFGLAGLSLLGNEPSLEPVDPVYCLPKSLIDELNL